MQQSVSKFRDLTVWRHIDGNPVKGRTYRTNLLVVES